MCFTSRVWLDNVHYIIGPHCLNNCHEYCQRICPHSLFIAMYIMGFWWPSQKHRKSKVYNDSSKTFFICFFWAKYLILLSIRTAPLVVNHEESLKQHLIKKQQRKKYTTKSKKENNQVKIKVNKEWPQGKSEDYKERQSRHHRGR